MYVIYGSHSGPMLHMCTQCSHNLYSQSYIRLSSINIRVFRLLTTVMTNVPTSEVLCRVAEAIAIFVIVDIIVAIIRAVMVTSRPAYGLFRHLVTRLGVSRLVSLYGPMLMSACALPFCAVHIKYTRSCIQHGCG